MALRPDPAGTGPLYLQLVERLEAAIGSGRFRDGDPLPPERILARGAGRVANDRPEGARRADPPRPGDLAAGLRQFRRDPLRAALGAALRLHRGHGAPGPRRRASAGSSAGAAGRRPDETMALNLGPGDDVCRFVRLRFADGEPMCIERAAIPARYLPDPDVVDESLYAALAGAWPRAGAGAAASARRRARAGRRRASRAARSARPVMATVRHGFLADDRPIELTRSIYRADRYDFVAEMRRGPGAAA